MDQTGFSLGEEEPLTDEQLRVELERTRQHEAQKRLQRNLEKRRKNSSTAMDRTDAERDR